MRLDNTLTHIDEAVENRNMPALASVACGLLDSLEFEGLGPEYEPEIVLLSRALRAGPGWGTPVARVLVGRLQEIAVEASDRLAEIDERAARLA